MLYVAVGEHDAQLYATDVRGEASISFTGGERFETFTTYVLYYEQDLSILGILPGWHCGPNSKCEHPARGGRSVLRGNGRPLPPAPFAYRAPFLGSWVETSFAQERDLASIELGAEPCVAIERADISLPTTDQTLIFAAAYDGRVVIAEQNGKTFSVREDGSVTETNLYGPVGKYRAATFHPDGKLLAVGIAGSFLYDGRELESDKLISGSRTWFAQADNGDIFTLSSNHIIHRFDGSTWDRTGCWTPKGLSCGEIATALQTASIAWLAQDNIIGVSPDMLGVLSVVSSSVTTQALNARGAAAARRIGAAPVLGTRAGAFYERIDGDWSPLIEEPLFGRLHAIVPFESGFFGVGHTDVQEVVVAQFDGTDEFCGPVRDPGRTAILGVVAIDGGFVVLSLGDMGGDPKVSFYRYSR